MRLKAAGAVVALFVGIGSVQADPVYLPSIVFPTSPPAPYTPGESFTFELQAPPILGTFNYDVTLQLQVTTSAPGAPPLSVSITPPGSTSYPFPSTSNFTVGPANVTGPGTVTYEISDSSGSSLVVTPPGKNDLAVVTVTPSSSLDLPITISVALNSYHVSGNGELGFSPPPAVTIQPNVTTSPVPTPAAWLMFGCGGLGVVAFRNRFGRAAS